MFLYTTPIVYIDDVDIKTDYTQDGVGKVYFFTLIDFVLCIAVVSIDIKNVTVKREYTYTVT